MNRVRKRFSAVGAWVKQQWSNLPPWAVVLGISAAVGASSAVVAVSGYRSVLRARESRPAIVVESRETVSDDSGGRVRVHG